MQKLIDPRRTPIGGWKFLDPDTGYKFELPYKDRWALMEHIKSYREMNKLKPIENLGAVIEDYICSSVPGMGRQCTTQKSLGRTVKQYIMGTLGYARQSISELASSEVAEKRAKICVSCIGRFNDVAVKKNWLEKRTDELMLQKVGNRKTSVHEQLGTCRVCSCPLAGKVWMSREVVDGSLTEEHRASLPRDLSVDGRRVSCWQLEEE